MTSKNTAEVSFNPKFTLIENEAKINFMKFKSQNVDFFNSVPHFDCDATKERENECENIDSCPTKKLNFFNDVSNSFNILTKVINLILIYSKMNKDYITNVF